MWKLLYNCYYKMSLKSKIRGMFLGIAVMYLVLSAIAVSVLMSQSMEQYVSEHSKTMTESVGENLNSKLRSISDMTRLITSDSQVIRYLKSGEQEDSLRASANATRISAYFDYIYSIVLIADNGQYTFTGGRLTKVDQEVYRKGIWKEELDKRKGGYIVRLKGGGLFKDDNGTEIISLMRRVYDINTLKPIGYLVVNMPIDILKDVCRKANGSFDNYYFMDLDGNCLENRSENVFTGMEGNNTIYTQKVEKSFTGMKIMTTFLCANESLRVGIAEKISFAELLKMQFNAVWLLLIVGIIFSYFLLGTFLSKTITNPIEKLCYSMEQVKTGYFRRVSMKLPNDEIGRLKDTYNNMLVETNKLIEHLVEKEKEVQSAELKLLQEQINPHFLYNTLDAIGYMIFEKSPEETYDAVAMLGRFYRKFLSKGQTEISLSEEISIVKDYLGLQRLRYGDLFEVTYEVPENMDDIYVPKLMLQPLVENSIYHGIKLKGEPGQILIQVIPEEFYVIVRVRDNGIGMTETEIQEWLYRENKKSFGFKGTMKRIEHYYGAKNLCTVKSEKGKFFEVTIRIPKGKKKPEKE